jgi:hypothetical protein
MTQTSFTIKVLLLVVVFFPGCDTGLGPLNEPAGFRGTIHFTNWPPVDSVKDLRLVAFETFPSDSAGIVPALLTGRAVVYPPIGLPLGFPQFQDTVSYELTTQETSLQLKKYDYVIVVLRYGRNLVADWKPVGVYTTNPGSFEPSPVRVLLHKITPGIDIVVDFHNPPPKPWR